MDNENLNEIYKDNSKEIKEENSKEINEENSKEINEENSKDINEENSKEINEENSKEINEENSNAIKKDSNYKEVKINKMIINGKEQESNIITIDDTKGKQEINITVYTQDIELVPNKEEGKSIFHEWIKKGIFRNKRK